jgi:predicted secreted hydrolase
VGIIAVVHGALYTNDGFRIPDYEMELSFPRDHGSHPEYKIEWWYFVGHLHSEEGREFGFQVTFFRYADRPPDPIKNGSPSDFAGQNIFLAHVAFTDIEAGQFYFQERLNREGWDAYSSNDRMDIRNGNWTASMQELEDGQTKILCSATIRSDVRLNLELTALKPFVRFGDFKGLSIKGPERENCSIYITFTRLKTGGSVRVQGKDYTIADGLAWMDHEISSSQLGGNMEGWDWTCIQLEDGWEVKAYILRLMDGSASEFSRLIWVSPQGDLYYQTKDVWQWNELQSWTSPETGIEYSTSVEIVAPHPIENEDRTFRLYPRLDAQEIRPDISDIGYWEGACDVLNEQSQSIGKAYLELTGYGEPIGEGVR